MPELPEVETVRRQIAPRAEGRRIAELEVLDERWSAPRPAREIADAVRGRRIERVGRRGKYLSWTLAEEVHLVMHLRMTGNLLYDAAPQPPHTRVRIVLSDDHEVLFVDQRRFGTGELVLGDAALAEFFAQRLGLEPFDEGFTTDHLHALGRGSRAPIKAFLLDQRRIAGVGNIYADEALYRARIHPLRPAGRLTRAQWERLRLAIIDALRAGIDARGATIDDFRDTEGARGSFQDQFLVHLRQGQPCLNCGREIVKLVAAGRGTYVCEACQPRPRRARRK